jgi:uncharacterized membrane protein YphA (DoxX/SURF4 family)
MVVAIMILFGYKSQYAGMFAGLIFLSFFFAIHVPKLAINIHDPLEWTVFTEMLALATGSFIIAGEISAASYPGRWSKTARILALVSRYLFAGCLIVFGTQHFLYADFIETLIPPWIPGPMIWSYVIRFLFLLAALSLITGVGVRFVLSLLGIMFIGWVLVLHAPRSFKNWSVEAEWTSLCIALAMGAISFSLAAKKPSVAS